MQCHGGESTIQTFSEVLLWLFVINLGIAFGAGLYKTRTSG
jgi:lipoprotein signal peptidase